MRVRNKIATLHSNRSSYGVKVVRFAKRLVVAAISLWIVARFTSGQARAAESHSQKVVRQGDNIFMSFRYRKGMEMHLEIGRCGINRLVNIKALYVQSSPSGKVSPWLSHKSKLLLESSTDWIGPYTVKSDEDSDNVREAFTGGWHGSNGDATGSPTARLDSLSVSVRGKPLMNDYVYKGAVRIHAVDYVMAFNTIKDREPVIKEVETLDINGGVVNVQVDVIALKKITILKYYGLQAQDFSNKGAVRYGDGPALKLGPYSDSGAKGKSNIVNKFSITPESGECTVVATMDTTFGLGRFRSIGSDMPTIFTEPYGKTYFNLIRGKGLTLRKGEEVRWKGSYAFE